MTLLQLLISIIFLGSWVTFFFVRIPRLGWGLGIAKCRKQVFNSRFGINLMKTDWILRVVTFCIYLITALGFSAWLPEQFCELIGEEGSSFNSCKWQIFGFRFVFILLSLPAEALIFAVVYRNATDMIFKIQLRKLTGTTADELELKNRKNQKNASIAYLMDPDIALNRRNVFVGRNPQQSASNMAGNVSGRDSMLMNMSERGMLGSGQASQRFDDNENSSYLPQIAQSGRRGRLDYEFGDDSDDTDHEEGND